MDMEEAKVEAEGQRSNLLGRRCKEKLRREENFGLLLALAVAVVALYAVLMMLAAGESWIIGFALTASGLSWVILEIAQLEITGFATQAWVNRSQ